MDRQLLRQKAKTEYKKMLKTLPKNQHIAFNKFFQVVKGSIAKNATTFDKLSETAAIVDEADMAQVGDIFGEQDINPFGAI